MGPELSSVIAEFDAATARATAVVERAGDRWTERPAPGRWCIGECIDHLNRTSELYLTPLEEALRGAPTAVGGRMRRDLMGWLLCTLFEPPARLKSKTIPKAVPPLDVQPADAVMNRFVELQDALKAFVERSDSLAVAKTKMRSPFDARVKYSVYSAFRILAAHQRRHLWQAERVLGDFGVV